MLSLCHHATSSPERWSSRWWARQTGTMNSSLTLTSECAGLCEGEVMRVRGHAAAHQARLPQYEPSMVLITQANRLTQSLD